MCLTVPPPSVPTCPAAAAAPGKQPPSLHRSPLPRPVRHARRHLLARRICTHAHHRCRRLRRRVYSSTDASCPPTTAAAVLAAAVLPAAIAVADAASHASAHRASPRHVPLLSLPSAPVHRSLLVWSTAPPLLCPSCWLGGHHCCVVCHPSCAGTDARAVAACALVAPPRLAHAPPALRSIFDCTRGLVLVSWIVHHTSPPSGCASLALCLHLRCCLLPCD